MSSPSPIYRADMAATVQDLERRIRVLETSNQLLSSSIMGGVLTIYNSSGQQVASLGDLPGGGQGVRVSTTDPAQSHLRVSTTEGVERPFIAHPWVDPSSFKVVTSGTFVEVYRCIVELSSSDGILFRVGAGVDAATIGELRLMVNGTQQGGTKSLPAGTVALYNYRGPHGATILQGPHTISLEARRASGTANVNIYVPSELAMGAVSSFAPPVTGWV